MVEIDALTRNRIIGIGKTYEANRVNRGDYSMGEARLDMALYLGAESWTGLTTEQRREAEKLFNKGRQIESKYHA